MLRKYMLGLLMVMLAAGTAQASETVYKWMDASGQVHFTDRPPRGADAKILSVIQRNISRDADDGGSQEASPSIASTPAGEPRASAGTVASVQEDVNKARAENCKKAQDRYKSYVESRRLFRDLEGGKREYLSDQELAEARVRAKQAVDEYCS